jgi:CheY-like chemotaxis protein
MPDKKRSPSVLIVNQDPSVLILLASMLERNGFRALFARSADEAVEITSREFVPVDLILCNVDVNGVPGTEVASRVRSLRPRVREMYLATAEEEGALRVRVVKQDEDGLFTTSSDMGLVDQVRRSVHAPMVATA